MAWGTLGGAGTPVDSTTYHIPDRPLPYRRPYTQPQLNAMDANVRNAVVANRPSAGDRYAQMRLNQFAKIAALMGGDFASAFGATDMSDPRKAYTALSTAFALQAKNQGIADPRVLLSLMLQRANSPYKGQVV